MRPVIYYYNITSIIIRESLPPRLTRCSKSFTSTEPYAYFITLMWQRTRVNHGDYARADVVPITVRAN